MITKQEFDQKIEEIVEAASNVDYSCLPISIARQQNQPYMLAEELWELLNKQEPTEE